MSVSAPAVKKFVNDPEDVVPDALGGMAAAHPGLVRVDFEHQLIIRADAPVANKVGIISGGGSGHEPLHGGFVGAGMLDAACAGAVFTSPVPDQMAAATRAVDAGAGVRAHRQELHRRRPQLPAWPPSWPRTTASRSPTVLMDDDVRRAGLAVHGRPPRHRRDGAGREDRRAPAPRPAARWPRSPRSPRASTPRLARSASP